MTETPKINNIGFGDTYPADVGGAFNVFITSLKQQQQQLWSEENIYLNKLCNVKVLSSHAFCIVISFSLRCMVPLKIMN